MDYEISQLSDADLFFFYGEPGSDVDMEIQSDLLAGLMQSKRTLFYNRQDSAGVADKENFPNSLILAIMSRYDVTTWNAYRNAQVSDGTNGNPDRRISVSQSSVSVLKNEKGEFDISVGYIPFKNYQSFGSVNIPITRGS